MPLMPLSPSDANRAGYDRWADIYDSYSNSTVATDDLHFPSLWAHVRKVNVLEIGCGTGRHTLRLAMADNTIVALDMSPGMLKVARQKLAEYPNVRLVEADFMTGGHGSLNFDAVVTALVLEHIADLPAFFLRVQEALAPRGTFFLSEIHPQRIAAGTQANFIDAETGDKIVLSSFAHKESDIQNAALQAGLLLRNQLDIVGDEELASVNPDWRRHIGRQMIRIWCFEKA
jgi:2-polyprenyl-3-methyl-5-hydroxy-6-metoxy-1,4-benzoquinol methylase